MSFNLETPNFRRDDIQRQKYYVLGFGLEKSQLVFWSSITITILILWASGTTALFWKVLLSIFFVYVGYTAGQMRDGRTELEHFLIWFKKTTAGEVSVDR